MKLFTRPDGGAVYLNPDQVVRVMKIDSHHIEISLANGTVQIVTEDIPYVLTNLEEKS